MRLGQAHSVVSEYAQEIPQLHTRHREEFHRTLTATIHQEDKKSKETSYLFLLKMSAKLEKTKPNSYQNKD